MANPSGWNSAALWQRVADRFADEPAATEARPDGPDNPWGDASNFLTLNAYFTSIGGGTDQIQPNIIAAPILGLPREPEVDGDVPFRDARKAMVQR